MKKLISIISICLCASLGSAVATTQPEPASDFDTPKFKAFKEQLQQMNQRAKVLDQQKANKESDYQIPSYLVNFSPEASFKVIAMGDGLYGLNAALNHTNPTAFDALNRSALYMQVATQTKLLASINTKLGELIEVERSRAGASHV